MPLSQNKSQSEKKLMIILGFSIFIIFIITVVSLLKNSSETKKPVASKKTEQNPTSIKKEKAPLVSSPEVKLAYEKKFKEILSNFETELQKTGGLEKLDSSTIQEYKNILLQEIVPREYLDLHLDFVLMLDMVSNQQIAKAQDSLQKIKSNI
jgi:hypothetical protein